MNETVYNMADMDLEFEIAQESLSRQLDKEVLGLRDLLNQVNPENEEEMQAAIRTILFVGNGIVKISGVINYLNAWKENGDPPQLGPISADSVQFFMKELQDIRESADAEEKKGE